MTTVICNFVGFSADSCTIEYKDENGNGATQTGSSTGSSVEFTLDDDSLMPNTSYNYNVCAKISDMILTICVRGTFKTDADKSKWLL